MLAFDSGYAYETGNVLQKSYAFEPGEAEEENRITTDGNTALTYGLCHGCQYGSITYQLVVFDHGDALELNFQKYGGVFIQSEDELAAISGNWILLLRTHCCNWQLWTGPIS